MGDFLIKADSYFSKGQWQKAVETYLEARSASEGEYEQYAPKLANAMHKSGNHYAASVLLLDLAQEVHETGKVNKSISLLKQALEINPEEFRARKTLAEYLESENLVWDARVQYKKLLTFYINKKLFHKGLAIANKLVKSSEGDIEFILLKLQILEGLGHWEDFSNTLKNAFDTHHVITINSQGFESNPVFQKLQTRLEQGLDRFPEDPILLGLRARITHLRGNHREAIRLIGKSFQFNPSQLDILETLASSLHKLKKDQKSAFVVNHITENLSDFWLEKPGFVEDLGILQGLGLGRNQKAKQNQLLSMEDIIEEKNPPEEKDSETGNLTQTQHIADSLENKIKTKVGSLSGKFELEFTKGKIRIREDSIQWNDLENIPPEKDKKPITPIPPTNQDDYWLIHKLGQAKNFSEEGFYNESKRLLREILEKFPGNQQAIQLIQKIRTQEILDFEERTGMRLMNQDKKISSEEIKSNLIKDLNLDEGGLEEFGNSSEQMGDLFLVDKLLDISKHSTDIEQKFDISILLHEIRLYQESLTALYEIRHFLSLNKKTSDTEKEQNYLKLQYFIGKNLYLLNQNNDALMELEIASEDYAIPDSHKLGILSLLSLIYKNAGNQNRSRHFQIRAERASH